MENVLRQHITYVKKNQKTTVHREKTWNMIDDITHRVKKKSYERADHVDKLEHLVKTKSITKRNIPCN